MFPIFLNFFKKILLSACLLLSIKIFCVTVVGVFFPMGKEMYRVVHIPEEEAVLLNSREKAPYMICVEVLKGEVQRYFCSCMI